MALRDAAQVLNLSKQEAILPLQREPLRRQSAFEWILRAEWSIWVIGTGGRVVRGILGRCSQKRRKTLCRKAITSVAAIVVTMISSRRCRNDMPTFRLERPSFANTHSLRTTYLNFELL